MKQKDLAAELGISPAMVSRLARRGMPTDSVQRAQKWRRSHLSPARVKGNRADTVAPSRALAPADGAAVSQPELEPAAAVPSPDTGYSVDRARREKYEADMAEIKLREQQGDLVRKADVRAAMAERLGDVRTNLLQIPARLAPLLALESDQAKVYAMLDGELRSVLVRLTSQ